VGKIARYTRIDLLFLQGGFPLRVAHKKTFTREAFFFFYLSRDTEGTANLNKTNGKP
jgi:hypothetical protein